MNRPKPRKYDQETKDSVLDQLFDGVPSAVLASTSGIPERTILGWKSQYESPSNEQQRAYRRGAFKSVMETCNDIRTGLGSIRAMDYSQNTGGTGTQYGQTNKTHQLIEFEVDVRNAAEQSLSPAQLSFFKKHVLDQDIEELLKVQDAAFMTLQERLGQVFIRRKIFPCSGYFTVVKQKVTT